MRLNAKSFLFAGLAVVLLAAIPLTIFFVQQQQSTKSSAAKSTTLSLTPANTSTTVGQTVSLDVMVDPGQNQISFIKLYISYDPAQLATSGAGFSANAAAFPAVIEDPEYTSGQIVVSISVGADPTKVIQTPTKAATITFSTIGSGTSQVTFGSQTQVLSIADADAASENVLSTTTPATVTIGAGSTTGTPTPTTGLGATVAPTIGGGTTPTSTPGVGGTAPTATPTSTTSATPTSASIQTTQPTTAPPTSTAFPTEAPTATPMPPSPTLTPGPQTVLFNAGVIGIIAATIGGLLFFAL